ncbi:MAG: cupredoxin domain-containing protein [Dehalococcoidia bacterium]
MTRRRLLRAGVSLAALTAATVALAACGSGSGYRSSPAPTTASAPAGGATTVVKAVQGAGDPNTAWKFVPAAVTVPVGATVTFTNTGSVQHTATADGGSFDTGAISAGASKTVSFSKAGTFAFHCSFHPWMKGTITVTASAAGGAPGSPPATAGAAGAAPPPASYTSGY